MKTVAIDPHIRNILFNINKSILCSKEELTKLVEDSSSSDIAELLASNSRIPNLLRVTDSGGISEVVYSFSVHNSGESDGIVLGGVIKPGETFNFNAGSLNNFYPADTFTYDATGTELIIIYNS